MTDVKSWLFSKGVWGGLIALIGVLANLFGYTFGLDDQTMLGQQIDNIVTAVGAIIGIYGRVMATKMIGTGS